MKKIAIFVEGETELEFVSKLLQEIAGEKRISIIESQEIRFFGKIGFLKFRYHPAMKGKKSDFLEKSDFSNCKKSDFLEKSDFSNFGTTQ
jgi:hypothetical protein